MAHTYHPDYGLPNELRVSCVEYAAIHGVKKTQIKFNVSASSIYKWRKQIMENHNA